MSPVQRLSDLALRRAVQGKQASDYLIGLRPKASESQINSFPTPTQK